MNKRFFLSVMLLLTAMFTPMMLQMMPVMAQTKPLAGKTIVIDPAWGGLTQAGGRGMATIGVAEPTMATHYFESQVNWDVASVLKTKLTNAGATVVLTRTSNDNNSDLSVADRLAKIPANADYFVSIQASAHFDGSANNYLYLAYRGDDNALHEKDATAHAAMLVQANAAKKAWRYLFEPMGEGFEPFIGGYTYNNMKVGNQRLAIMEHNVPGFVSHSYFRTYQPARQRALSEAWRNQEASRLFRAIAAGLVSYKETTGDIMGVVKSSDEKMKNSPTLSPTSFAYIAGTHDQYKPLNGATVQLLNVDGTQAKDAAGKAVAAVTVDNNYNGIFAFTNLLPGTYKIRTTMAGYFSQEQNVEVTANEAVYPIFLLSQDKNIPTLSKIDGIAQRWEQTFSQIVGDVRRVVQMDENIVVLSHDTQTRKPHLYAINHRTKVLSEISTQGLGGYDAARNPREYLTLSDIGVTDDGKLVGCNFVTCYYGEDDGYVEAGGVRDALRFFKWETITSHPTLWVSKSTGGVTARENFHCVGLSKGADMGYTMAVNGSSNNCVLTVTGVDHDYTLLRYAHITVVNNEISDGSYTKSGLANPSTFLDVLGKNGEIQDYRLNNSPLGAERWVIDGTTTTASEFIQTTSGSVNTISGAIPDDLSGLKPIETSYVNYKGNILMLMPYYVIDNGVTKVKGVRVLDLNKHDFAQANKVNTGTVMDLATPVAAKHATATGYVDGNDLHLFLIVDKQVIKYSTITEAEENVQSADRNIFAYALKRTDVNGDHTQYNLTFKTNTLPIGGNATVVWYKDGVEVYREVHEGVVKAANTTTTITVDAVALAAKLTEKGVSIGDELTWGIEVEAHKVREWALIASVEGLGNDKFGRAFHAVDRSPESPQMGRIYVIESNTSSTTNNGVYVVEATYSLNNVNKDTDGGLKPCLGGQTEWVKPGRPVLDSKGVLYIPELSDKHPGIYLAQPGQTSTSTYTQLFAGTATSAGVFEYKNGAETIYTGSNHAATAMTGKDGATRLIALNEDKGAGNTLPKNGLVIYQLGQQSGNVLSTWNKAPSDTINIGCHTHGTGMDASLRALQQGIFVGLRKASAQTADAPALMFYDWDGNRLYSSFGTTTDINMMPGAGIVVAASGNILLLDNQKADGSHELLSYDIVWRGNVPELVLRDRMPHSLGTIYQMSFDYSGNLVVSGTKGLHVYATPSVTANKRVTPARQELTVVIPDATATELVTEGVSEIAITNLAAKALANNLSKYEFTFTTNVDARAASIVFYGSDGSTIITEIPLKTLPKANVEQKCTIAASEISNAHNDIIEELRWGVKVTAKYATGSWNPTPVASADAVNGGKMFHTVNTDTSSDRCGEIYVMNNVGAGNANNGMYIYNYDHTTKTLTTNSTLYKGGTHQLNDPYKLAMDATGRVYMSDQSATHAGVFTFDPANPTMNFAAVFNATYPTTGSLVKNGSTVIGAATPTVAMYGTGTNTKMLTFSAVAGGDFTKFDVLVYTKGTAATVSAKPSILQPFSDYINAASHVVAIDEGIWLLTHRGTNATSNPALNFFTWEQVGTGKVALTDYKLPIDDPTVLPNTTIGAAFTVSEDGKILVVEDGSHKWHVLEIDYTAKTATHKQSLTPKLDATTNLGSNTYQLNIDAYGNLIASGAYGLRIYEKEYVVKTVTVQSPAVAEEGTAFKHVVVTDPTQQPVRGIFAYDLRVQGATSEPEGTNKHIEPNASTNAYEFTFMANEAATKAEIIFYSSTDRTTELMRKEIPAVTAGANSITISAKELPENGGNPLAWSIELTGENVTEWGILSRDQMNLGNVSHGGGGVSAINNNPQSDKFGRIYAYYKAGSTASGNYVTGSHIYTPLEDRIANPAQANSPVVGANLARMSTDDAGNLYLTSKSDDNPGIFIGVSDKNDRDKMTFRRFFHNSATIDKSVAKFPIIKYNGTEIGSAMLGVDVIDMGGTVGQVLVVYANGHASGNSDPIPHHSVLFYELGPDWDPTTAADNATSYGWTKAPSKVVAFARSNIHGDNTADVWSTSHGFWTCHMRSFSGVTYSYSPLAGDGANGNNSYAASLLFVSSKTINSTSNNKVTVGNNVLEATGFEFNSGWREYQNVINGSEGGAMAMSADEKTLVMLNATGQFLVFDVLWTDHVPTLTLRAVYNTGIGAINQMDFDYGGNLVTTGTEGMATFAIPDPNKPINRTETPAMNMLLVKRNARDFDRVFKNTTGDKKWSNANNWEPKEVPGIGVNVLIEAPCEVDVRDAAAKKIDLLTDKGTLTILPTGALTVATDIRKIATASASATRTPTVAMDLLIQSATTMVNGVVTLQQGILAQFDTEGKTQATVQLAGKYSKSTGIWQHVGVPFDMTKEQVNNIFGGSWMFRWDEPSSSFVQLVGFDNTLNTFTGYMLGQKEAKVYTMQGTLLPMVRKEVSLSAAGERCTTEDCYDNYGANFLANPYTAPLRIDQIDVNEHLKNVEATIYIYDHTNSENGVPQWTNGKLSGYATYPIGAAAFMNDPVINPLQGFYLMATAPDASIELHPKMLIAGASEKDYEGQPDMNPYNAPRKKVMLGPDDEEIPVMDMHIRVESNDNLHCNLLMLESEMYTDGYDNGWDGRKLGDDYGIPYLAAASKEGDMAVLATPDLDGTFLTFYAGTGTAYTLVFTYEGDDEYLLEDAIGGASTPIRTGESYHFTPTEDDRYRFRVVRKPQYSDTTTETPPDVWANGDRVYLTNPAGVVTEVMIYSADGKLIESLTTSETIAPLHVPMSGMYVISLRSELGVKTIKHIL